MKKCTKCKKIKEDSEFYKRCGGKYLQSICKICDKKLRKAREEKRLGRFIGNREPKWSKEDIKVLLNFYSYGLSLTDISEKINRTESAISTKLWELNKSSRLLRWTKEDIKYLENKFSEKSMEELAKDLNRTVKAIEHQAIKSNLIFRKATWIEKDIEVFLKSIKAKYISQKHIGKYWADFLVENTIIEVQGSYWHCDSTMFPEGPVNKIQEINKKRDLEKKSFLLSKDYNIIYIWEKDVKFSHKLVCEELHAVLNRNVENDHRAKSVELLRDNTEVNS